MAESVLDLIISSPLRRSAGLRYPCPTAIPTDLHSSIAFCLARNIDLELVRNSRNIKLDRARNSRNIKLGLVCSGRNINFNIISAERVTDATVRVSILPSEDRIRLDSRRASWKPCKWYSHCECLICDGNGGTFDMTSSTNDRSLTRASSTVGGKSRSWSVSGKLRKCC